jgi:hypothetical protein
MEQTINTNRKSNLLYFIYFIIFYAIVFTNNFYIFCFLFAAIIVKFCVSIINSIYIINEWQIRKQEFRKLNYSIRYKSTQLLFFTYLFIFLSLSVIITIIIYRFDFWSGFIFK